MPQRAREGKACRQTPSAGRREPTKLPTALWTSSGSSVASAAAMAMAMLSRTAAVYIDTLLQAAHRTTDYMYIMYIITSSAQDNRLYHYMYIDTGVENSSLYRAATAGLEAKL